MKEKLITLLQTIINKIRGLQMTAPIPQEKFAGYLEDVIGVVNDADLDVPNELPTVAAADKGKFLHANESTGALEWAESGSGGVLAVHDVDGTLDKTWREIINAVASTGAAIVWEHEGTVIATHIITSCVADPFTNKLMVIVADINRNYAADSESDYPVEHEQQQDSPILA